MIDILAGIFSMKSWYRIAFDITGLLWEESTDHRVVSIKHMNMYKKYIFWKWDLQQKWFPIGF